MLGRRGVAERLVRALFIVEPLEGLEALDLLAQRTRRRIGGVLQQRQMQPLKPAVLLRLARRNPLRHDAGLDHLHRQLRQPARAARGKRRAVVGTQRPGQAEFAEGRIEHRPDMLVVGACQAPGSATDSGCARRSASAARNGVPSPVRNQPLKSMHHTSLAALQCGKRRARGRAAAPQPALHRQPFAIEQLADRARRRPLRLRRAPLKPGSHLHRPPASDAPAAPQGTAPQSRPSSPADDAAAPASDPSDPQRPLPRKRPSHL